MPLVRPDRVAVAPVCSAEQELWGALSAWYHQLPVWLAIRSVAPFYEMLSASSVGAAMMLKFHSPTWRPPPAGWALTTPPRANHTQNEVQAVTAGANADEGPCRGEPRSEADAAPTVEQLELSAGAINVTINHVDKLVVQQAPDPMPNCGF